LTLQVFMLNHGLHMKTYKMNLPWFVAVAKARMSLGLAHKHCQESLPKELVPGVAELWVILG